jgi:hypothetical protein
MIELTDLDKKWIKLCKGHYDEKYGFMRNSTKASDMDSFVKEGKWFNPVSSIDTLKPMYNELYLYDPEENPRDFIACMFHNLFDLYMKITEDRSSDHRELKEIFFATFEPYWLDKSESTPIERAVTKLVSLIRLNTVFVDGVERYNLEVE